MAAVQWRLSNQPDTLAGPTAGARSACRIASVRFAVTQSLFMVNRTFTHSRAAALADAPGRRRWRPAIHNHEDVLFRIGFFAMAGRECSPGGM
jgi:hypothetical protein